MEMDDGWMGGGTLLSALATHTASALLLATHRLLSPPPPIPLALSPFPLAHLRIWYMPGEEAVTPGVPGAPPAGAPKPARPGEAGCAAAPAPKPARVGAPGAPAPPPPNPLGAGEPKPKG